jgi:ADP-ribose pyrophosphatase
MVKRDHWEYVERPNIPGAVAIVAVTEADELLLVEQYRVPLDRRVIELPAGLAGDGDDHAAESFADSARRELLEETGYQADEMVLLAAGPTTAGLSNEQVSLFQARRLTRVHAGGGEGMESLIVHHVHLAQVRPWLRQQEAQGKLIDIKIFAGLYFLASDCL